MSLEYPRVNLLHKSEQRYQGVVSRRFMLVSLVATPLLLVVIIGAVQFVQRNWLQSNLDTSREIWEGLQPRLAMVQEERRGLKANEQVLDLFNGWKEAQLAPVELLEDVQNLIPENIQITKLSIRSESGTAVYAKKEDLKADYSLVLEGIAYGELAETAVIQLRKDFLASPHVGAAFESINLASMRKRNGLDGSAAREFRLVGKGAHGGAE